MDVSIRITVRGGTCSQQHCVCVSQYIKVGPLAASRILFLHCIYLVVVVKVDSLAVLICFWKTSHAVLTMLKSPAGRIPMEPH